MTDISSDSSPDFFEGVPQPHPVETTSPEAVATAEQFIAAEEPQLFQSFSMPEPQPIVRIPNFGHTLIFGLIASVAAACSGLLTKLALSRHLFGVYTAKQASTEIHYALGSEAILYLLMLAGCLIIFPIVWQKPFFTGLQWNFATAMRLRWKLAAAAFSCFLFALLSQALIPGPTNAPIDNIFQSSAAAWMLFAFGITFAPFFEEMAFRGFLLPAVCTAFDWFLERDANRPALPLGENNHPQWSMPAMVTGAIVVSIPFALLHAEQTGWSIGPFCLLVAVSLVLCAVRLRTRSQAASTLMHAMYNFLLFSTMLLGTDGFRHLDKM
jgi:hypothetical protein